MFLKSKFCSLIKKQKSSHCKHKGARDRKKHSLEDYKESLEIKESEYGGKYSFQSNKHAISMVKQKKIALNPFDDKRCYFA